MPQIPPPADEAPVASTQPKKIRWSAVMSFTTALAAAVGGSLLWAYQFKEQVHRAESAQVEVEAARKREQDARERERKLIDIINREQNANDDLARYSKQADPTGQEGGPRPFLAYRVEGDDVVVEGGVYTFSNKGEQMVGAKISGYPPGEVRLDAAPAASKVLSLLKKEVKALLEKRESREDNLFIDILGTADGIPVRPGAVYAGEFGNVVIQALETPSGMVNGLQLIPGVTPLSQEKIAALRCVGLFRELATIPQLAKITPRFEVLTTNKIGPSERCVLVRIRILKYLSKDQVTTALNIGVYQDYRLATNFSM